MVEPVGLFSDIHISPTAPLPHVPFLAQDPVRDPMVPQMSGLCHLQ